ncbi:MAG: hypothetical protein RL094_211 [Candidatus Parcubacteria bacterium]|jgi:hypothetical protein
MEKIFSSNELPQFKSPEEELNYLRQVVASRESASHSEGEKVDRAAIISEELAQYRVQDADRVLHEHFKIAEAEKQEIVLELSPETHDKKIEELLPILYEKGIYNTLSIIDAMNSPHLDDDFHRFLIEYIKKGYPVTGLSEDAPLYKTLTHTLYEVALPETKKEDQAKALKELLSSMEQFYAGMLSVAPTAKGHGFNESQFTIELAVADGSDEFVFYVSVPNGKTDLFEKQILSIFANARISEKKDDYNVFNSEGIAVASVATQAKNSIFPIKTYEGFDYDPLNVILNTLSKLEKTGEGAAIQIIINPVGDYYVKHYKGALDEIQKGTSVSKAIDIQHSFWGEFKKLGRDLAKDLVNDVVKGDKKKDDKPPVIDSIAVDQITKKVSTPIVETNIRVVASASSRSRAEHIISDIESSFNQFQNSLGNTLSFKRQDAGSLKKALHNFSYRIFTSEEAVPLSLHELTSVMHFPVVSSGSSPQLKQSKAGTAPAPLDLPKEGLFLGTNKHRNVETKAYIGKEDRLRHFYAIGQTGTGKSTMLRNMIIQDIKAGHGVCFIDPHGSDVQDILSHIPPERYDDLIYFDPSHTDRPMALNMLEYNRDFPEQKTFVVNELFSIFQKLYGGVPESMGPMFEQYFRNATMLVIEDPDSGSTLLDVSRVMAVKSFRDMKISKCKNPVVVQFWKDIAEKAGGEGSLQNMVPYITSKFDVFLANDIMRPIIAQEKSSFNFREIMDSKKILLVNLAKGRLGDINSSLIGLILVGKILMAALSRVDSFGKDMNDFYLYIDEFQNITTPSISTILSEARKYKLSLNIAHQFIAQLDEKIKDAVFGNVGSMAVFRVGAEDAEFLQKQFEPVFTANDIMNIDNMNAYIKMLSRGRPTRPFNIEFTWPPKGNEKIVEDLKQLSYLKYGQDRAEVEAAVMEKYKKEPLIPRPSLVDQK